MSVESTARPDRAPCNASKGRCASGVKAICVASKTATRFGKFKISPPEVFRDAARYGIQINHILGPNDAGRRAFKTLLQYGFREDELEEMSAARFLAAIKKMGVDVDIPDADHVAHYADLFWSVADDRPLVAVYHHNAATGRVALRVLLDAEKAFFDGVQVSEDDIYRVWRRRYPTSNEPPDFLLDQFENELAARAAKSPRAIRVGWSFLASDPSQPLGKPAQIRPPLILWTDCEDPSSPGSMLDSALAFEALSRRIMRKVVREHMTENLGAEFDYCIDAFRHLATHSPTSPSNRKRHLARWRLDPAADRFSYVEI